MEVCRGSRRVHLVTVKVNPDLEVGERQYRHRELSGAGVPFRRCDHGPRTFLRVGDLRRVPRGMEHRVDVAVGAEHRRAETILLAALWAHLVRIQELARHLALKPDVVPETGRYHELGADEPAVRGVFASWRSDEVSVRGERKVKLAASARREIIETGLYRRGVVGDAVALRAEVADAEPAIGRLLVKSAGHRRAHRGKEPCKCNQMLHARMIP